jgi:hypothetical protein
MARPSGGGRGRGLEAMPRRSERRWGVAQATSERGSKWMALPAETNCDQSHVTHEPFLRGASVDSTLLFCLDHNGGWGPVCESLAGFRFWALCSYSGYRRSRCVMLSMTMEIDF